MNDVQLKVKDILNKYLEDIDINGITDDTHIVDDLGADSLDMVEIIMIIEEEFGVTISDNEAYKLTRVKDIVEFINNYANPYSNNQDNNKMKMKTLLEEFQEEPTKTYSTIIDNKIDDIINWINDFEDAMENGKIGVYAGEYSEHLVKRIKED